MNIPGHLDEIMSFVCYFVDKSSGLLDLLGGLIMLVGSRFLAFLAGLVVFFIDSGVGGVVQVGDEVVEFLIFGMTEATNSFRIWLSFLLVLSM